MLEIEYDQGEATLVDVHGIEENIFMIDRRYDVQVLFST